MKRTETCGELRAVDAGRLVTLNGWVAATRDHGGISFVDIRDRYGVTQVVFDPATVSAADLKLEYCIAVRGSVRARPDAMRNPAMATGEIELAAEALEVLSVCATLPFVIDDRPDHHTDAREVLRLRHRYLDLRSASMQRNIALRHRVTQSLRGFMVERDFLEIETPTLIRSTPEGARDYVVPSRVHVGSAYALPQSPQIFKQILMLSGFDRYFQVARCYRDEDARGDRQPEFTQLDLEMSFVEQEDVLQLAEQALQQAFRDGIGYSLPLPFPRVPFDEALNRYGSDRPDLRYELELQDFATHAAAGEFGIFKSTVAAGASVKALRVPGGAQYSRKQIEAWEEVAKTYGAKGLAWMKCGEQGLEGGIARFYEAQTEAIQADIGVQSGDLLLLVGAAWRVACTALGAVRGAVAEQLGLRDPGQYAPCFVTDFPMFARDEEAGSWIPEHHVFSMPHPEFLETLESDPGAARGAIYDAVINGAEIMSGSLRIYDPALQQRVFGIIGVSAVEAERRFGFMLDAFRYAPPPHGGAAMGLDRIIALMAQEATIREVIAFPKTTAATSPMDNSPAPLDPQQLADLGLSVNEPTASSLPPAAAAAADG
jgi:aspartyl-tRNA synthetase